MYVRYNAIQEMGIIIATCEYSSAEELHRASVCVSRVDGRSNGARGSRAGRGRGSVREVSVPFQG